MMLHEQQIRRVQHYKYLDVVFHKSLYHTMRLDYNQVAVCNSMLVVSSSCKPPTHNQLSDTNMFGIHSSNGHVCTGSDCQQRCATHIGYSKSTTVNSLLLKWVQITISSLTRCTDAIA
ncbi:hypothetical protein BDEG_28563 [Batrachochytrium dendrobatidis JEL423]|uniref:Uncharacterized protein n=1 Tax=Batrachochytrium dendrobatidis (strain JEL423) TaxID=403673 RepID=A0A177WZA1_BATDL|nr:hypothetical protein BDEG_28563 [Batrachochytrium dendrobatidis JEL423]